MGKNKKGSLTDLPFIIAGIFSVAVFAFLVTVVLNNLDTQIQDNEVFNQGAKSASEKMSDDFPAVMDGGIVFLFFGMVFVSLILAGLVAIHPVFLPFYILEYVVLIWLGAGIANAYESLATHALFAVEAGQFEFTIFFFQYFPYAIGFAGALLAIVMYKVKQNWMGG